MGAGIEWALASNWSVKIEYNYLGLNSQTNSRHTKANWHFTTANARIKLRHVYRSI